MTELEFVEPAKIEARSFEILTQELPHPIDERYAPIIKRVIHTTADFDYADTLYFSENVLPQALDALRAGATIVTDTQMAYSGINKPALRRHGCEARCFISDPDVAAAAKAAGITRSAAAMDKASQLGGRLIFAIGNAPTALIRLRELLDARSLQPSLIIGVPVGFVNVVASKEQIIASGAPCIVARGRKGGSSVAAAICNALLYLLGREES
ncbi:MAG: precorrin-8X methylmutase [Firmicutes bacterium]|nr:precorrin-8X methylmutase [Bacillota bacterium]